MKEVDWVLLLTDTWKDVHDETGWYFSNFSSKIT